MLVLKYLLMLAGVGLFGSAAALVVYDIYISSQLRRLLRRDASSATAAEGAGASGDSAAANLLHDIERPLRPVRWRLARQLVISALVPVLLALSIIVVPDGSAGVRVSQIWGARPGTLYPGVHIVTPLIDSVVLYDTREQVYTTRAAEPVQAQVENDGDGVSKATNKVATQRVSEAKGATTDGEVLLVQAREGLNIGLAVSVRYRLDPQRLSYIHANLPQPVGEEVVAPTVATIYRQLAPNYITREIFATKREELRSAAASAITTRLGADGIIVREVLLRDLKLPDEYAKGLEGLLLKEQENEQLGTDQEIKQKQVRIAELEAEAQKAREVKQAEAQAQVRVLQAKAEADAMQYTLPLKQKQIEQSKLEAQARKEATLQNADAAAQAKIIDSKAELERQHNLAEAEANRIRVTAAADSERMKFEAAVLKSNPMLIQKIIAERLSDKLQIMMVPVDGKNFFANDVFRSAFSGVGAAGESEDGAEDGTGSLSASKAKKGTTRRP
ncbi:MAG TPA: SPFH domain-containing protein [Candidatus Sulfotelmatobacter sp.]|nr:SPFH domain-containing protein [Candidatus Sulfotelmatobacter sp.]